MQNVQPLLSGNFYHIFNCGINGSNIFSKEKDYLHFIRLYDKYISPVADSYAWVLMPNHFHFLVKIREGVVYRYSIADKLAGIDNFNEIKWETVESGCHNTKMEIDTKRPKAHLHFSHLFNAYSRYFNQDYERHGALFERSFKRKCVDNRFYLKEVLLYIHENPVHHNFCQHPMEYPWSSYLTLISLKPTKLKREEAIGWFDDEANFKTMHQSQIDIIAIENFLEL
jgi:putative transposase